MPPIEKVNLTFVSAKNPQKQYDVKTASGKMKGSAALVATPKDLSTKNATEPPKEVFYMERDENDMNLVMYTKDGQLFGRLQDAPSPATTGTKSSTSSAVAQQGVYSLLESPVTTLTDKKELLYTPAKEGGGVDVEEEEDMLLQPVQTATNDNMDVDDYYYVYGVDGESVAVGEDPSEPLLPPLPAKNNNLKNGKGGSGAAETIDLKLKGQNLLGSGSTSTYTLARDKQNGAMVMVPVATSDNDARYEKGYLAVTPKGTISNQDLTDQLTKAIAKKTNCKTNAWMIACIVLLAIIVVVLLILVIVAFLKYNQSENS